MTAKTRPKVVVITGSGRSGSTLLSLILSQHPDVQNLAQVRDLQKAFENGETCSCGEVVRDCAFWSRVADDSDALRNAWHRHLAFEAATLSMKSWSVESSEQALQTVGKDLREQVESLYERAAEVSGKQVLIDVSKPPQHSLLLSGVEGLDVRVINLARDPRAVACSWYRKEMKAATSMRQRLRAMKTVLRRARDWRAREQRAGELQAIVGDRHFFKLHYEDFVKSPSSTIARLFEWMGLSDCPEGVFTAEASVEVSWRDQHLFPPINEKLLAEKRKLHTIVEPKVWMDWKFWPVRLAAMLAGYPQSFYYLKAAKRNSIKSQP